RPHLRTSFHHQPEAQHPKSSAIHKNAGRLPHLLAQSGQWRGDQAQNGVAVKPGDRPACAHPALAGVDLDDRIAAAFQNGVKSDDVKALIVETEAAAVAAGEAAERARQRALDPALSARDVTAARREMDNAAFRRERLQTAVSRLKERLKEV